MTVTTSWSCVPEPNPRWKKDYCNAVPVVDITDMIGPLQATWERYADRFPSFARLIMRPCLRPSQRRARAYPLESRLAARSCKVYATSVGAWRVANSKNSMKRLEPPLVQQESRPEQCLPNTRVVSFSSSLLLRRSTLMFARWPPREAVLSVLATELSQLVGLSVENTFRYVERKMVASRRSNSSVDRIPHH